MGEERVAVAMSGGVDSSVTAALLVELGYSVEGYTMLLWRPSLNDCVQPDYVASARSVCRQLGIPFHVLDLRQAFYARVVEGFAAEYARGRTPNPCLICNQYVKFGLLLEHARQNGCDRLATGHYARIMQEDGRYTLMRAVDVSKDQSYFLYSLDQERLATVLFPLGAHTKRRVRELAAGWNLTVAQRPESQDACFLEGVDYRKFLVERWPEVGRPGPIVDRSGHTLGRHKGLAFYTVGQREGLGIAAPHPLYVIGLDTGHNALVVGWAEELGRNAFLAEAMRYVSGEPPSSDVALEAKIRYRAIPVSARITPLSEAKARIDLGRPLRDITPGQAVVLYAGECVVGGGVIASVMS